MHCGANTYQASSEQRGRQRPALGDHRRRARRRPRRPRPTANRPCRARRPRPRARPGPGTSAIEICQLKPIGANTCCSSVAEHAGEAVLDRRAGGAGAAAPGSSTGTTARTISEKMMLPTRRRKIVRALPQAERQVAQAAASGTAAAPASAAGSGCLIQTRLQHPGHAPSRDDAGDVQHEQHQAVQVERRRRVRAGTKAPISSA